MTQRDPFGQLVAVLVVGIGGFAGSNLRYFVELVVPSSLVATATVNILGCIAIGFILYLDIYTGSFSQSTRTILATGFIASFTTYSTFVLDVLSTSPYLALAYALGSYALGFGGVLVGRHAATITTNSPSFVGKG